MNLLEKRDLVRLLNKYQEEILSHLNINGRLRDGDKTQYNHARIISNKISKEISNEIVGL